jgi:energy-coupling factor transporter transmembrane protein EcfT
MAISLTISFIPRIMDEAATIRDAAMSRGLGLRRSILRRAVSLALPMAEVTLRRADITTDALLSRSFTENPTPPDLKYRRSDVLLFLAVTIPPGTAAVIALLV